MPRRYMIASYLPEGARRAAATESYAPTAPEDEDDGRPNPRTIDGGCPLGVALAWMGLLPRRERLTDPEEVADALDHFDDFFTIRRYAARFIDAWDAGRIRELDSALGVRP